MLHECREVKINKISRDGCDLKETMILADEARVILTVDDSIDFNFVCSPCDVKELCIGRIVCEGMITSAEQMEKIEISGEDPITVSVKIHESGKDGKSCDFSGQDNGKTIVPSKDEVFRMIETVGDYQKMHQKTGATHSCALFCEGELVKNFEDIGRHNALNKAVGYAYDNNMDVSRCALYFTGRVMSETVERVASAHIPMLITKSLPMYEAVEKAKRKNIALVGRAWPDSYCVFE